ncbi:Erg28-like protein [Meira miltonrushii]|uniref:Erg28-like protein n=1 Tax=Meira miltonrushii TaxID=1280837 RepID=A0A316VGY5_9BASI|nr:Erg28-like protein [Meira miltonrushii]PWN36780.1 Erg28-like protein [Meira miltonrushii]
MSWLPETILGKWLLLVGTIATFSGLQSIADTAVNRKVYTKAGASITPLSARLFGVWNILSAVIRVKCAYDLKNESVYQLTMFTFALALAHFSSEVFVYKTATLNSPGTISPFIVASSSFLAMAVQYHNYAL